MEKSGEELLLVRYCSRTHGDYKGLMIWIKDNCQLISKFIKEHDFLSSQVHFNDNYIIEFQNNIMFRTSNFRMFLKYDEMIDGKEFTYQEMIDFVKSANR